MAITGPVMTSQDPNGVQIDRVHGGAICTEIGERLRTALTANPARWPPALLNVVRGDVAIEIDFR
jgi:hypothetical protein